MKAYYEGVELKCPLCGRTELKGFYTGNDESVFQCAECQIEVTVTCIDSPPDEEEIKEESNGYRS